MDASEIVVFAAAPAVAGLIGWHSVGPKRLRRAAIDNGVFSADQARYAPA